MYAHTRSPIKTRIKISSICNNNDSKSISIYHFYITVGLISVVIRLHGGCGSRIKDHIGWLSSASTCGPVYAPFSLLLSLSSELYLLSMMPSSYLSSSLEYIRSIHGRKICDSIRLLLILLLLLQSSSFICNCAVGFCRVSIYCCSSKMMEEQRYKELTEAVAIV